jgi:membrane protease YdiL (CAAX protease family)
VVIAAHPAATHTRSRQAVIGSAAVVAVLAAINVAKNLLPSSTLWLSVFAAAVLLLIARRSGLTWAQLGMGRHRVRHGAAWAAGAIVVVAAVYVAGLLMPETRAAFLDTRYHLGIPHALLTAFVVIPVGTVLLEEVAFRSVLWGMLKRHMTTWRVILVSSSLFGLWHVLPSLHFASANRGVSEVSPPGAPGTALVVLVTVLFTALGGVVAGELRRRSGSVLASAGMHWATNALGVLFGVIAWRLAA